MRNKYPCVIQRSVVVLLDAVKLSAECGVFTLLGSVDIVRYYAINDELYRVIVVPSIIFLEGSNVVGFF